ncbi:MAG TPA: bifunctional phosphopantothenoylcysteine decarboxylase/phosphopantothenate--cysteine ligase CoaBC [Streptosporangiaceae bacterium]|nr:bifunctional phosphopantothenoylcysteine decarboxylase/phosphopantothenate--cysteine ligase CoaBC [Streptosporangiaceae bacterium]
MSARVVLGVGAGIAAYKSCELLRLLTESGHRVRVVPTPDALRFVGEATWAALSGEPVTTDAWTGVSEVPHVRIGQSADLVIVAPATADLMARAAAGMAGDLLTATLLTARCPVLYAPAMHTEMWEHPATQANVALLRSRGAVVLEPAVGRLTGVDSGAGRLPEPPEIFAVAIRLLARGRLGQDLAGRRMVVSAGGTREEIDPVRFIGNWSSGTQGYALVRTAVARGAEVTVVAANIALADPAGAKVIRVVSAREMRDAIAQAVAQEGGADAVVMAAAVADYRPEARSAAKIKKDGRPPEPLRLTENPDILAELAAHRGEHGKRQVLVGFAAETDTSQQAARAKLARKGCDLLVVNPVGNGLGFGTPDNEAVVFAADGTVTPVPRGPKEVLADVVWDLVAANLERASSVESHVTGCSQPNRPPRDSG